MLKLATVGLLQSIICYFVTLQMHKILGIKILAWLPIYHYLISMYVSPWILITNSSYLSNFTIIIKCHLDLDHGLTATTMFLTLLSISGHGLAAII